MDFVKNAVCGKSGRPLSRPQSQGKDHE